MGLARVRSQALVGIESPPVDVEVHVANGLPAFHIVGLPTASVRESRDRVRAAIQHSGFDFPNRKLTVNLAPADLPKDSSRFDLPIAIGVLVATDQLKTSELNQRILVGELSLTGNVRGVSGALAMALAMARRQRTTQSAMIVPIDNAAEVAVVPDIDVYLATSLTQVVRALAGEQPLPNLADQAPPASIETDRQTFGDFKDVRGLQSIKRALEIAAAGAHSVLMLGPPGAGKSMLAQRLAGVLPAMTGDEALQTGAVTSLANRFDPGNWRQRPFRAPHHSASMAALVGGGPQLRPGEISLAHHGVLFLDELPQFGARTLDSLREPLETGRIALSRAARQLELPARFQLICAMNPCPCGFYGKERCRCSPDQVLRYQQRVSGPLLDRLDLNLWVEPVPTHELTAAQTGESSAEIADRVSQARHTQLTRQGKPNAQLDPPEIVCHCPLDDDSASLLHQTAAQLNWSGRVFHRIQKVARTIADLTDEPVITTAHLAEAIGLRRALGLANAA